jgi:hypothetical protein
MKKVWFIFSCVLFFLSCKKEKEDYSDAENRAYFPLTMGKQIVYDVDSVIWDDFTCVTDTNHYQMRWTVGDSFYDNESRLAYRINVEIRETDTMEWRQHRVYAATPTASMLEFAENNLRFIKLIFPIQNGSSWDGNTKIETAAAENQYLQQWKYEYVDKGNPFDNEIMQFANTVTVLQKDEEINDPDEDPYATKTFAKEVYAKDVGLVYREVEHWIYDQNVSRCRAGFAVKMRAVSSN